MIKELEHLSYKESLRPKSARPGKINIQTGLTNVYKYMGCVCKEEAPRFFFEAFPILMIPCGCDFNNKSSQNGLYISLHHFQSM